MDAESRLALGVRSSRVSVAEVKGRFGQSRVRRRTSPCRTLASTAPTEVTTWVALDVHKHSIVAGVLPASGGAS